MFCFLPINEDANKGKSASRVVAVLFIIIGLYPRGIHCERRNYAFETPQLSDVELINFGEKHNELISTPVERKGCGDDCSEEIVESQTGYLRHRISRTQRSKK